MDELEDIDLSIKEKWVEAIGYAGLYEVSDLGRVKSLERNVTYDGKSYKIKERIRKIWKKEGFYPNVHLSKNGKVKTHLVHLLVLESFTGKKENYLTVNHINEIKHDNRLVNLEWCTQSENNTKGTKILRTSNSRFKKRIKIDKKTGEVLKVYNTIQELTEDGYKLLNTKMCCMNVNRTAHGYVWRYLEEEKNVDI